MRLLSIVILIILISGCIQKVEEKNGEGEKMVKVLFVIAPKNFKDEEYYTPKDILEKSNIKVVTTSNIMEAISVNGKKQGVDILLDKININEYNGVVFVGGPGASVYFNDRKAISLAKDFFESNKLTAAICIAPSILANAGVLNGKRATAFPSEKNNLENKGAIYTNETVTVDGNIVTGNGPGAAKEFGKRILELLK